MHTMYSTSNAVIEWLLIVKMLETEIHLFRNSAILLFRIPRNTASPKRYRRSRNYACLQALVNITGAR